MRTNAPTMRLYDMHCHLGFVANADAIPRCPGDGAPGALSCTVSPSEFERDRDRFADRSLYRIALGLHPWRITEKATAEDELRRFEALAPDATFIGEVGLDFGGVRGSDATREAQRAAFDRVLAACDALAAHGTIERKLLSIHAVRAAGDVLDSLDAHGTLAHHQCVFHWFSGTSVELKRAVHAGCFFSIGPRMLATKRGREYARIIPVPQLLLETDSPSHPNEPWDHETWSEQLRDAGAIIAELKRLPAEELFAAVSATSERLLLLTPDRTRSCACEDRPPSAPPRCDGPIGTAGPIPPR